MTDNQRARGNSSLWMLSQQFGERFAVIGGGSLGGEAQRKIRTLMARAMAQCLSQMVGAEGFEPPTLSL